MNISPCTAKQAAPPMTHRVQAGNISSLGMVLRASNRRSGSEYAAAHAIAIGTTQLPHTGDHFWTSTSKHAYAAAPSAASTIVVLTRVWVRGRLKFSMTMAALLSAAAVHNRAPMGSPINTADSNATR